MPAKKTSGKSSTSTSTAAKTSTAKTMTAKTTKRAKKQTKETSAPVVERSSPVVETSAPVVETSAPVVETTAPVVETSKLNIGEELESEYQNLMNKLSDFKTLYAGLTADFRKLQKSMNKYIRESSKRSRRPKNIDPNRPKRPPSGFAKPALISNELCSFLGVETGTEMARTEVTKHLTTYIKENNLQDQANRRRILPDSKLQTLLNVTAADELTYFNLQKFMKVHFPKPKESVASSSA